MTDNAAEQGAKIQAELLAGAQAMVEHWPVYLEGLTGMVALTVQHGWTEHQARWLVLGTVLPAGLGDPGDPGSA